MKKIFQLSLIAIAFVTFVLCPPPKTSAASAQSGFTGDWKAEIKTEKQEKIYLSFERRTEHGRNQSGSNYDFADLQGLTREQAQAGGTVKFTLAREAGNIECEGKFENGKGSGTFRFSPSQSFADAMKKRGFDFSVGREGREDTLDNRLFTAATLNLTTAFVDDLKSANFGPLTVDDVFKARIFNITPQFMSEMKATGFPNLGMEELVKARIFKIDASYVRDLGSAGFKDLSFEDLVKASIFKVNADFARKVKAMGFDNESMESLVKMQTFKITPEFIKEVQDMGFKTSKLEDLVQMRIFNVTGAYIKELKDAGLANLTIDQLVKMRIFKIDGEAIRKAKSENVDLDVNDLVNWRIGIRSRNSREM